MRSLSGPRNRAVLLVAGVLVLVAAAWLTVVAFQLVAPGQAVSGIVVVPEPETVAALVEAHHRWLLPTSSVAAFLAVLGGVALLIAQFPAAPMHTVMRIPGDNGTVLATLEPQVLERALIERVSGVTGVVDVSLRVSGPASALTVQGELTVAEGAMPEWTVDEARRLLAAELDTVLGAPPRAVDLLVRLRSSRGDRRAVAVRGDHGQVSAVSAAGGAG